MSSSVGSGSEWRYLGFLDMIMIPEMHQDTVDLQIVQQMIKCLSLANSGKACKSYGFSKNAEKR